MLRITRTVDTHCARVKLEGAILAAWLPEVKQACDPDIAVPVELDLTDVTYVDAPGRELLEFLLRRGVRLFSCSSFVAELLQVRQP